MRHAAGTPLRIAMLVALVLPLAWAGAARANEAPTGTGGGGQSDFFSVSFHPRDQHVTRFEREKALRDAAPADPTLAVLNDGDMGLAARQQPVEVPLSAVIEPVSTSQKPVAEIVPTTMFRDSTPFVRKQRDSGAFSRLFWWCLAAAVVAMCARLRVWQHLDRAIFLAVQAVRSSRFGSGGRSTRQRRRGRSHRGDTDVKWYFRAPRHSSGRRRRRSIRPREFVVADAVFTTAAAPATAPGRYLLTYSGN